MTKVYYRQKFNDIFILTTTKNRNVYLIEMVVDGVESWTVSEIDIENAGNVICLGEL